MVGRVGFRTLIALLFTGLGVLNDDEDPKELRLGIPFKGAKNFKSKRTLIELKITTEVTYCYH